MYSPQLNFVNCGCNILTKQPNEKLVFITILIDPSPTLFRSIDNHLASSYITFQVLGGIYKRKLLTETSLLHAYMSTCGGGGKYTLKTRLTLQNSHEISFAFFLLFSVPVHSLEQLRIYRSKRAQHSHHYSFSPFPSGMQCNAFGYKYYSTTFNITLTWISSSDQCFDGSETLRCTEKTK